MKSEKKYQRSRTDESSVSGGGGRRGGDRKIEKKNQQPLDGAWRFPRDFLADSQTGHLIRDNSSRRRSADTEDRRNRGGGCRGELVGVIQLEYSIEKEKRVPMGV